jgi:hypothetical protein
MKDSTFEKQEKRSLASATKGMVSKFVPLLGLKTGAHAVPAAPSYCAPTGAPVLRRSYY